ncbi:MAG: hypothetical protein RL430_882, partial [Actinomycetota bacterium]
MKNKSRFTKIAVASGLIVASGAAVSGPLAALVVPLVVLVALALAGLA